MELRCDGVAPIQDETRSVIMITPDHLVSPPALNNPELNLNQEDHVCLLNLFTSLTISRLMLVTMISLVKGLRFEETDLTMITTPQ